MGTQKRKWRVTFDKGSVKYNKSGIRKIPMRRIPESFLRLQNYKAKKVKEVEETVTPFQRTLQFYNLLKENEFQTLDEQFFRNLESYYFFGNLDQRIKICITHSRIGLKSTRVENKSLPLIILPYLQDYCVCAYIKLSTHIFPITSIDEDILFVAHDKISRPLHTFHTHCRYTTEDLQELYHGILHLKYFEPDKDFIKLEKSLI